MIRALAIALALACAPMAHAEPYPAYTSIEVNDFAGLLDPQAEARLAAMLSTLRADTGIELVVVTLPTRAAYDAQPSIEAFATGLFNAWGIGNAERNDGILVLVLHEDREMRLELGSAYHQGFDVLAQEIISADFLPDFREGAYQAGIERGTASVIDRIARPHAEGTPPVEPAKDQKGNFALGALMIPLAFVGILLMALRRRIGDFLTRFRACPNCGGKTLRRHSRTMHRATTTTPGAGETTTACSNCGYTDTRSYTISRKSSSKSSSFGGGRSSGGGASGRW